MSTLSCGATEFNTGCENFCVIGTSPKRSSIVEWYSYPKYGSAGVSRCRCAKYQNSSTLKCWIGINGIGEIVATLLCRVSLKFRPKWEMGCVVVVNVAECVAIMHFTLCN